MLYKKCIKFIGELMDTPIEPTNLIAKALFTITSLQIDLINSIIYLTNHNNHNSIVSICVLARTIIENQGSIRHIGNNKKRAELYLKDAESFIDQIAHSAKRDLSYTRPLWTSSKIEQRIGTLSEGSISYYNFLSNFTHGNNISSIKKNTKELLDVTEAGLIPIMGDLIHQIMRATSASGVTEEKGSKLIKELSEAMNQHGLKYGV